MVNKYKPPDYNTDIDEGVFSFKNHGSCVYKPNITAWERSSRTDIINFSEGKDNEELTKHLRIGDSASKEMREKVISMVKAHWDAFCSEGCRRPVIGYEFAIDTGTSTPVCKCLHHFRNTSIIQTFITHTTGKQNKQLISLLQCTFIYTSSDLTFIICHCINIHYHINHIHIHHKHNIDIIIIIHTVTYIYIIDATNTGNLYCYY